MNLNKPPGLVLEVENQINDTTPVPFTELTLNERIQSLAREVTLDTKS